LKIGEQNFTYLSLTALNSALDFWRFKQGGIGVNCDFQPLASPTWFGLGQMSSLIRQ
jgi:hypothetical protein